MIKRFNEIHGLDIEIIAGQQRLGYTLTSDEDFYDLADWQASIYPGSQLYFYDLKNGDVYSPFAKKDNIMYGEPLYAKGLYYFLQGDFSSQNIILYCLDIDEKKVTAVYQLKMADIDLYNLQLLGTDVYITSQDDRFQCYYPTQINIPLKDNESVVFIDDDKIYIQAWIEEGWDEENNEPADNYRYYNRLIIKDFTGKTISDEVGSLIMAEDGTWWIG